MKTSILLLVVALLSIACRSTSLAAAGNVVSLADTAIITSGGKADVAVALHAESLPTLDLTLDIQFDPSIASPVKIRVATPFSRSRCVHTASQTSPGTYRVSFACPRPFDGTASPFAITFKANASGGTMPLVVSFCEINGQSCMTSDGRLQVVGLSEEERKCRVGALRVVGQHHKCRMDVAAAAMSNSRVADFTTCDAQAAKKLQALEDRFGEVCFGYSREYLQRLTRQASADRVCQLSGSGGPLRRMEKRGSVVVTDFDVDLPSDDPTLSLRNVSNMPQSAWCFYVTVSGGCAVSPEFRLTVAAQSERAWKASSGFGTEIPPVAPIPFAGSLVCVAVDPADDPIMSNAFIASTWERLGSCAVDGEAIEGIDFLAYPDFDIALDGLEYGHCPPARKAEIETCWTQAESFNFSCE